MSSEMAIERTHRYAERMKAQQDFKQAEAARRKLDHDASYTARTTESASAREERHAAYDARCRKAAAKAGAKADRKINSNELVRDADRELKVFCARSKANYIEYRERAIESATHGIIMGNISAVDFLARNTVAPQNDYEYAPLQLYEYDVRAQSPNAINWHEVKAQIEVLQTGTVSVNEVLTQGFVPKKDIAAVWIYVMSKKYGPESQFKTSTFTASVHAYEATIGSGVFPADFFSGGKSGHCVIL